MRTRGQGVLGMWLPLGAAGLAVRRSSAIRAICYPVAPSSWGQHIRGKLTKGFSNLFWSNIYGRPHIRRAGCLARTYAARMGVYLWVCNGGEKLLIPGELQGIPLGPMPCNEKSYGHNSLPCLVTPPG